MTIEAAILGLLSLKPMTGYDIKKVFEDSDALYWSGNNNQIYKILIQLYERGWVAREISYQEKAPPRKIYSLTDLGRVELRNLVLTQPELPAFRHPFLVRLVWADVLNNDELDALLAQYEDEVSTHCSMCREQLYPKNAVRTKSTREEYIDLEQARTARETLVWKAILQNRFDFFERELSWVQQLRSQLKHIQSS